MKQSTMIIAAAGIACIISSIGCGGGTPPSVLNAQDHMTGRTWFTGTWLSTETYVDGSIEQGEGSLLVLDSTVTFRMYNGSTTGSGIYMSGGWTIEGMGDWATLHPKEFEDNFTLLRIEDGSMELELNGRAAYMVFTRQ